MRREDWLWLSIKVAGLWLLVMAVETATMHRWFSASSAEAYVAAREQILRIGVPLVSGLCLLLIDFARWLPVDPPEQVHPPEQVPSPEQEAAHSSSLSRADWLWVGLKIVGAYYSMMLVYYVGQFWTITGGAVTDWVSAFAGPLLGLAVSLWLLLGNTVWRVASREPVVLDSVASGSVASGSVASGSAASDPGESRPSRSGNHLRDLLVVVLVFAVLGSLPMLLLWWVGAE